MQISDDFYKWLIDKIFHSWAKKYQKEELFQYWLNHLTYFQILGFKKQYKQDINNSYVQKDISKTV